MSDVQLKRRLVIRRRIIISILTLLLAAGMLYFKYTTEASYEAYLADKAQESSLQSTLKFLQEEKRNLQATVDENGKQLVSFTEDKIKYINLASQLSIEHNVRINKLTVSDIMQEGAMSIMTTTIEVEGMFGDVQDFISSYCSTNYTNRINVVSCRPSGRYAWLQRNIDDDLVLTWFDLGQEKLYYDDLRAVESAARARAEATGEAPQATPEPTPDFNIEYSEEEEAISSKTQESAQGNVGNTKASNASVGVPKSSDEVINLNSMFAEEEVKAYLVVDFLGRS